MDSDFFDDESEEVDDAVMDCKWDTSDEDWESDTSDEDWVPGGGGVLRISSDGDDWRIFLGLKFSILEFFWVGKFGKYFFGVAWLGIQNNLKIHGSARVSQPCSSGSIKYWQPNFFCVVLIIFNDGVTLHCISYIKLVIQ